MEEIFNSKVLANATFDIQDLDGKYLYVKVYKEEDTLAIVGFDRDKVYILLQRKENA